MVENTGGERKRKASSDAVEDKFEHPITVGTRASCFLEVRESDSKNLLPCTIVERRNGDGKGSKGWDYYVHLDNSDRRLDQWITGDALFPLAFANVDKDADEENQDTGGKITRHKRRIIETLNPTSQKETGNRVIEELEKAREEKTKVKNIGKIVFGDYEISTWYFSPYPHEYSSLSTLYTCAFCLKYMRLPSTYARHACKCTWKSPPGVEIYYDKHLGSKRGAIKVFEIDGMLSPLYCQNLCLLAKLFLDHKTLCFDVPSFLFYVLTEQNKAGGWELVGFFSKEKGIVATDYNVACILVLPHHQRKGFGSFLIALSYELTKKEGKTGTPERPLSDLGQVSYHSFWTREVLKDLRKRKNLVGIGTKDVASATGILEKDVCVVLKSVGMLRIWKGEHMVSANAKAVEDAIKTLKLEKSLLNPDKLKWRAHPGSMPLRVDDLADGRISGNRSPQDPERSPLTAQSDELGHSSASMAPIASPEKTERPERPTVDSAEDSKRKVAPHRFTHAEIVAMKEFVMEHGVVKVRAPMNSPEGLQRAVYEEFSNKLDIEYSRCKEKIKRMAGDMMVKANANAPKKEHSQSDEGRVKGSGEDSHSKESEQKGKPDENGQDDEPMSPKLGDDSEHPDISEDKEAQAGSGGSSTPEKTEEAAEVKEDTSEVNSNNPTNNS
ncbi:hypothetical protein NDN08_000742 [Rhodosorus marinus]|uniref:histone acetyltransferase n=1 Tax=Rhodosorus marinus TaxID=101924 RepID=A0AAV8USG6_9RHOD|nr:hypothetical protein NDN08_000742 [Rhodosorus marinus]